MTMDADATESGPLEDLADVLIEKKLVIVGGYGAGASSQNSQQWRSMWDAFKQYGDGSDPPKEEIERSRGCNYYCGDCHALGLAESPPYSAEPSEPEWSRLDFGHEASALLKRTGHSLTSHGMLG